MRDVRRAPATVVEVRRFPAATSGPLLVLDTLVAALENPNGDGPATAMLDFLRAVAVIVEEKAIELRPAPVGEENVAPVASGPLALATTAI